MQKSLALLASGMGTNAEALIRAVSLHPEWNLSIAVVISDKETAPVLKRAEQLGVPSMAVPYSSSFGKKVHEEKILSLLDEHKVSWVCLAGYMRILSSHFLAHYFNKEEHYYQVVNIHPSLLPAFPGKDAYKEAFLAGVKVSGVTVHLVDEGIDSGPILIQQFFYRYQEDHFSDFQMRGKEIEWQIYPQVLELIAQNRIATSIFRKVHI